MPVFQEFSEESLSLENESIIFEEYGRGLSEEAINEMVEFFKFLMIFMLISLLLQALSEYAVISGINKSLGFFVIVIIPLANAFTAPTNTTNKNRGVMF